MVLRRCDAHALAAQENLTVLAVMRASTS